MATLVPLADYIIIDVADPDVRNQVEDVLRDNHISTGYVHSTRLYAYTSKLDRVKYLLQPLILKYLGNQDRVPQQWNPTDVTIETLNCLCPLGSPWSLRYHNKHLEVYTLGDRWIPLVVEEMVLRQVYYMVTGKEKVAPFCGSRWRKVIGVVAGTLTAVGSVVLAYWFRALVTE